jgi:hypothetical protein
MAKAEMIEIAILPTAMIMATTKLLIIIGQTGGGLISESAPFGRSLK